MKPTSLRVIPITRGKNVSRPISTKRRPTSKSNSVVSHWEPKSMKPKILPKEDVPEPELFTKVVDGEVKYFRKRYIPKKKADGTPNPEYTDRTNPPSTRKPPKKIKRPGQIPPKIKPKPEPEDLVPELPPAVDGGDSNENPQENPTKQGNTPYQPPKVKEPEVVKPVEEPKPTPPKEEPKPVNQFVPKSKPTPIVPEEPKPVVVEDPVEKP